MSDREAMVSEWAECRGYYEASVAVAEAKERHNRTNLLYPKGTAIYLHPGLHPWHSIRHATTNEPLNPQGMRAVGFCLVYDSLEDFRADESDLEPFVVEVIRNKAEGSWV
jgi:hypothetical protein